MSDELMLFRDSVRQSPEWAELQSRLAEAERSVAMYKRISEDQKQRNRDMRNTVNAVTGADAESHWHELFGTPERAARTLQAMPCGNGPCAECPMFEPCCGDSDIPDVKDEDAAFYDVLLEWLRGDAS